MSELNPSFLRRCLLGSALFLVCIAGCAGGYSGSEKSGSTSALVVFDRSALPDTVRGLEGFEGRIYHEGRLYISGQPTEDGLRALKAAGLVAVVNLRTPKETEDRERVPFDEQASVKELGLDYVSIPLGGDEHPYTPAAVEAFAEVLAHHDGPVLLHCTVGWRASHLWAAYLVRYQGFPVNEAYARAEAIGIGRTPFAKMIDRDLKLVEVD